SSSLLISLPVLALIKSGRLPPKMTNDIDHNYIEVGWWDVLAAPIALVWFFGLTWVICMAIIQTFLIGKNDTPAQPPFGRFYAAQRRPKNQSAR
ncbi:hypothetical protein PFISCL1PPCAC_24660, partial [Pristionchus fissidentatus]